MKRFIALLTALCFLLALAPAALAGGLSVAEVNEFLNTSAKLGEGSKANQVAVIPFSHIDGPKNEDLFYAFVPFKYVARNYIKYQVTFISCTCRSADVNVWSTAYVELTLPESGKIARRRQGLHGLDVIAVVVPPAAHLLIHVVHLGKMRGDQLVLVSGQLLFGAFPE